MKDEKGPGTSPEVPKHKQEVWKFIWSLTHTQVFYLCLTRVQKHHRIVILTPNGLFPLTCYFLLGFL